MVVDLSSPVSIWTYEKGAVWALPYSADTSLTPGDAVLLRGKNRYFTGVYLGEELLPRKMVSHSSLVRITDHHSFLSYDLVQLYLWLQRLTALPLSQIIKHGLPPLFPFGVKKPLLPGLKIPTRERDELKTSAPLQLYLPQEGSYYLAMPDERIGVKDPLLEELLTQGLSAESIKELSPRTRRVISKKIKAGTLIPSATCAWKKPLRLSLTAEQTRAVLSLEKAIQEGRHERALLYGVTGSGKTEVYIELTLRVLKEGRTALILVPEIALTPQLCQRFRERLGCPVEVWHSALTLSQRKTILRRILREEVPVLIGARSSLFLPLRNLGLVIVDEEHDPGHSQELGSIRISTRDLATKRGEFAQALVVLGSATPSLETWTRAQSGALRFLELRHRPLGKGNRALLLVDLEDRREHGPFPWLSKTLHKHIASALSRGESVILFRNRRGFHPIAECEACQGPSLCPNCNLPLAYHHTPPLLKCHLCGASYSSQTCPQCKSLKTLRFWGTGTQRIESEIESLFPEAGIARLDRDILTSHSRLMEILQAFGSGQKRILVGTQMVTKGLDFAHVTCVGIVDADTHLFAPDFRSSERVFQRIAQVSGRTGRREKPGVIVIQTRHPRLPLFPQAAKERLGEFYRELSQERERYGYPPFTKLLRILWESLEPKALPSYFARFRELPVPSGFRILGPGPAPLERARQRYRFHALIFAPSWSAIRAWLSKLHSLGCPRGTHMVLEFDPPSLQ